MISRGTISYLLLILTFFFMVNNFIEFAERGRSYWWDIWFIILLVRQKYLLCRIAPIWTYIWLINILTYICILWKVFRRFLSYRYPWYIAKPIFFRFWILFLIFFLFLAIKIIAIFNIINIIIYVFYWLEF